MADLVITAANVKLKGKGITPLIVQVGEVVTSGQGLYRKTSDSKYYKADNNVDAATALAEGVALSGASADGYVMMIRSGPMDVGATLTKSETYIVSTTAGGIAPVADIASGNYLTYLGYASTTSTLEVDVNATGVTK